MRDDQSVLDALFDEVLERLEHGERVLIGELISGREELRGEVERLVDLAERVSVVRPQGWPAVPGYTILGELGKGGMGTVYLARQERLGGRPVALKVLPAGFGASPRSRERFLLEARAVGRLRHPHIVAIHDVVESRDTCAFAMEWVDGTSLTRLIDAVRGSGEDAASVRLSRVMENEGASGREDAIWSMWVVKTGIAMARALEAVHGAGLLHRDVKPSNVLVRCDGTALLSDFGLVREEGSAVHTISGQFVGTPSYAAPEQIRGEHELDARVDVYGLGATLYHALALRRACEGESIPAILAQIEGERITPLRRVNPRLARDLETIVMKAMEAEPGRRYASAAEMGEDLERLVTLRPIRAKQSGPVTRAVKLVRRNRGRVLGGVIGGGLAVLAAAVLVVMVFFVPRWYEGHIRNARLALMGEEFTNGVFNRTYGGQAGTARDPKATERADVARALGSYQAAARLPGAMRRADRLEWEIVRMAGQMTAHPDLAPKIDTVVRARAPLTASFAESWWEGEGYPQIDDAALRAASTEDLRSLGLLAMSVGLPELAMRAWPLLDSGGGDDPLVEAALGYMYLMVDRPALAYPRLRSAAESFPNVGFIHTCVADAAVRVGDYERAEQILAGVDAMDRRDTLRAERRVRMDLLAETGRYDEALGAWGARMVGNPLVSERVAWIFEKRGQMGRGVRAAVSFPTWDDWRGARAKLMGGTMPRFWEYERFLVGVCERWWGGLEAEARAAFVAGAGDGESYEHYVLERYALARHRLATWPERARLVLPGGEVGADEGTIDLEESWDEAAPSETLPLAGVCARLGVNGAAFEP